MEEKGIAKTLLVIDPMDLNDLRRLFFAATECLLCVNIRRFFK